MSVVVVVDVVVVGSCVVVESCINVVCSKLIFVVSCVVDICCSSSASEDVDSINCTCISSLET